MDNKNYVCNICCKYYKTSQSLWNHKNKYHTKNNQKMTNFDQLDNQNMTNCDQSEVTENAKIIDNTTCQYCNKKLSAYTHLRRHLKICKNKIQILKENEQLKKKHEEMEKNIDELKKIMLEMMNKQCKMHPKKLNKLINNSHNTTNSHNNLTINNNQINIIELGDEKLNDIFTKEEKLKILKRGYSSLEEIIKHTHLNDKYLQLGYVQFKFANLNCEKPKTVSEVSKSIILILNLT